MDSKPTPILYFDIVQDFLAIFERKTLCRLQIVNKRFNLIIEQQFNNFPPYLFLPKLQYDNNQWTMEVDNDLVMPVNLIVLQKIIASKFIRFRCLRTLCNDNFHPMQVLDMSHLWENGALKISWTGVERFHQTEEFSRSLSNCSELRVQGSNAISILHELNSGRYRTLLLLDKDYDPVSQEVSWAQIADFLFRVVENFNSGIYIVTDLPPNREKFMEFIDFVKEVIHICLIYPLRHLNSATFDNGTLVEALKLSAFKQQSLQEILESYSHIETFHSVNQAGILSVGGTPNYVVTVYTRNFLEHALLHEEKLKTENSRLQEATQQMADSIAKLATSLEQATAANLKLVSTNETVNQNGVQLLEQMQQFTSNNSMIPKEYGEPPQTHEFLNIVREIEQQKSKENCAVLERFPERNFKNETNEADKDFVTKIINAIPQCENPTRIYRHGTKQQNKTRIIKIEFSSKSNRDNFIKNYGKAITETAPNEKPHKCRRDMTMVELEKLRQLRRQSFEVNVAAGKIEQVVNEYDLVLRKLKKPREIPVRQNDSK